MVYLISGFSLMFIQTRMIKKCVMPYCINTFALLATIKQYFTIHAHDKFVSRNRRPPSNFEPYICISITFKKLKHLTFEHAKWGV